MKKVDDKYIDKAAWNSAGIGQFKFIWVWIFGKRYDCHDEDGTVHYFCKYKDVIYYIGNSKDL